MRAKDASVIKSAITQRRIVVVTGAPYVAVTGVSGTLQNLAMLYELLLCKIPHLPRHVHDVLDALEFIDHFVYMGTQTAKLESILMSAGTGQLGSQDK